MQLKLLPFDGRVVSSKRYRQKKYSYFDDIKALVARGPKNVKKEEEENGDDESDVKIIKWTVMKRMKTSMMIIWRDFSPHFSCLNRPSNTHEDSTYIFF